MSRILGLSVLVLFGISSWADDPLRIAKDESALTIQSGDRVLLRYAYGKVSFKPYVQEFVSPNGINVLRDMVPDHIHHHGLMFALAANGVDFWAETETCGRQVHRSFEDVGVATRDGVPWARFTERIDWMPPNSDEVLLKECRVIGVPYLPDAKASIVTWQTTLEVPAGKDPVTLTGSHYFGLGMRFPKSMDAIGEFLNAEGRAGEVVRGDERNTPATWCAYTAAPEGKPVTAAMFGHPNNVRHPTTWFTMSQAFAYMSATLNLCKEPLKIESGKPLVLRYAVAVWDATTDADAINRFERRWLAWSEPEPKS